MKISKKLFLFNFILTNIITFEILFSSSLIYNNKINAPIIILLFGLIVLLFLLIYPNIYHKLFNIIFKHKIIRFILLIYLLFFICYSFGMITFILNHWFYHKSPFFIILIFLLLPSLIISKNHHFIFYMAFILGIFVIIFNLLPIFNSIPRNFYFIKELKLDLNYKTFFLMFVVLDFFIMLIYSNNLHEKLSKKNIFISTLIIILTSFLMLIENYFFLTPDVFDSTINPSFYKYKIYFVNYLIDNIDIILIVNIIYFCFTKLSLYLNLFNKFFNQYKNKTLNILSYIIIYLISIFSYLIIFNDKLIINKISVYLTIILILVFFISIFYKKEVNNEYLPENNE